MNIGELGLPSGLITDKIRPLLLGHRYPLGSPLASRLLLPRLYALTHFAFQARERAVLTISLRDDYFLGPRESLEARGEDKNAYDIGEPTT